MELREWINNFNINCDINENKIVVDGFGKLLFIKEKDGLIIDKDFSIILSEEEEDFLENNKDFENILFKFGNRYYYCSVKNRKKNEYNEQVIIPDFNDFSNIGIYNNDISLDFVHLGIHTGYELLNGSGESEDWVKKAKFLNYKELGICEKNTLAGTLPFQLECEKKEIKSILGITISVAYNYKEEDEFHDLYDLKIYAKNKKGWNNVLRISKYINVDFSGFIPLEIFFKYCSDIVVVFSKDSYIYKNIFNKKNIENELFEFCNHIKKKDLYFQLDFTEYSDDDYDLNNLSIMKHYLDKYFSTIQPVYIEDSYYLEEIDKNIKKTLNKIDKRSFPESNNQYFKSIDEIISKYISLFKNEESFDKFLISIKNTKKISNKCNFKIETGTHKLPKYPVKNKLKFYNNLVLEGFERKIYNKFKNNDEKLKIYLDRVEEENEVIIGANLIDYFLILWDIINWSKNNDILVGPARGSAGGSLIAYLLNIIEIDPIQYDLLFERFLNKTRVSGERAKSADALPDIDVDFESKFRPDVKKYIEEKFNINNVCSIGTYTKLKIKSAIKDFGRIKGLNFSKVNFATKEIPDSINPTWSEIFTNSLKSKELKDFVQDNVDICEEIRPILGQPRSKSVHASAVIITPKEDEDGNQMEIYDWMPVKLLDGQIVSEWEGKYTDRAGFLKEDILGVSQLDKFKKILILIKNNTGKKIDLNNIPIDDKKVFDYFCKGWTEDVFQFGTSGLKNYSEKVKPTEIEDLISMNALFRPGPMDSNAHMDFVYFRRGTKKAQIDIGMENVVKKTQGLYIYQEQVMQAMVIGGLTLAESDQVRTYMKKFDKVNLLKFKEKFIDGYSKVLKNRKFKKSDIKKEANKVWDKLNAFSSYGFNRSHAAAYSLMGYWSQWLKVNYPLEFWTASLHFAKETEEIPNRISEIKKIGGIKVVEADINKSDITFTSDIDEKIIYWSLTKIKNVGDVAVTVILTERTKGKFFSLEDFLNRVPKAKVNKKVVINLIIAGSFDNIRSENMDFNMNFQPRNRYDLILQFFKYRNEEVPEDILNIKYKNKNWYWRSRQREITGFGDINYKSLVKKKWINKKQIDLLYMSGEDINDYSFEDKNYKTVITAGRIMFIKTKKSKRGEFATISLEHNNSVVLFQLWNDTWDNKKIKEKLLDLSVSKKIFAFIGELRFDSYKLKNVIFATEKTKIIEI